MKYVMYAVIAIGVLLVLSQVVRPAKTNPPVNPTHTLQASPEADPAVMPILERACRDCHSSQTVWPWYSNVAPISWFVIHDVNEGRGQLSFSEWATYAPKKKAKKLEEICGQVREGEMPMSTFVWMHPDARLSPADKQAICTWTETFRARLPAAPAQGGQRQGGREADKD